MLIRKRILMLLMLVYVILGGLLLIENRARLNAAHKIVAEYQVEDQKQFDQAVDFTTESLASMVRDYTAWDELVKFIQKPDPAFAKDNLDPGLKTFNLNAIWVLNDQFETVYHAGDDKAQNDLNPPIPQTVLKDLFATNAFLHTYVFGSQGLLEIQGASVHPSSDQDHVTPRQGYLLAARLLDTPALEKTGRLCNKTISLHITNDPAPLERSAASPTEKISVFRTLHDAQGNPIAVLTGQSRKAQIYQEFIRNGRQIFLFYVLSMTLVVTGLLWGLHRWIVHPLGRLSEALQNDNPELAKPLCADTSELGQIARLIERSLNDKEMLHTAKAHADACNRIRASILNNLGHELRTPMHGILGVAQLMDHPGISDEQKDYIAMIRESSESLLNYVEKLLLLAQAENATLTLSRDTILLREFFRQLSENWQPKAEAKGLAWEIVCKSNVPETVYGSKTHLLSILDNLCENAVKFTSAGKIQIKVDGHRSENNRFIMVWTIKDTGAGFPAEELPHLCEGFYQADMGLSRHHGGLGLGLAIVSRLVETMNGQMHIESVPGQGTAITVTLTMDC